MVAHLRWSWLAVCGCTLLPLELRAQSDRLTAGIQAADAHDFAAARRHFEAILRRDPASYEANWRLAVVLTDIAKQTPDKEKNPARDTLYVLAESYARHAIAAKPDGADGHFALADVLGRSALTFGIRERIKRGTEVRTEALRTVELNPRHDGAWHILGRWNAEVMRLPGLEKLFARTFLGASVINAASWDEAERDMRLAVEYAPTRIVHRFDLAEIQYSRQEWAAAKQQLDVVANLPSVDVSDPSYKRQARALEVKVMEKLHK